MLIGHLRTNFSEILIGIQTFFFKKMQLKMWSAKWCPFCLGFNELSHQNMHMVQALWWFSTDRFYVYRSRLHHCHWGHLANAPGSASEEALKNMDNKCGKYIRNSGYKHNERKKQLNCEHNSCAEPLNIEFLWTYYLPIVHMIQCLKLLKGTWHHGLHNNKWPSFENIMVE